MEQENKSNIAPLSLNLIVGGDQRQCTRHKYIRNIILENNETAFEYEYTKADKVLDPLFDVSVIFNPSDYEGGLASLLMDVIEHGDKTVPFLDVTEEFVDSFMEYDPTLNSYLIKNEQDSLFYFVCEGVGGLFCDSKRTQELLFNKTGRVGTIITPPKERRDKILEPSVGSLPMWYGDLSDIFSALSLLQENPEVTLVVPCPFPIKSLTEQQRDRIKVVKNEKEFYDSTLPLAKYFYFPKTSTPQGEMRRAEKVEEMVKRGKLVFAPHLSFDFKNLAIQTSGSLEETDEYVRNLLEGDLIAGIEDKQDILREEWKDSKMYEEFVETVVYTTSIEHEDRLVPLDEVLGIDTLFSELDEED